MTLGIETSCDETSVAVVRDGREVLSNVISSSKEAFAALAGVIPEEAARQQVSCMVPVLREAIQKAGTSPSAIDFIAVTKGPGLLGSLLVGTTTARVVASAWEKPLLGVHHTLGHLSSPWLVQSGEEVENVQFPILTLSASGGHTELWYRTSHTKGQIIGRTRDDAAGEAFDKGASLLGLPYPGGPHLARAAKGGDSSTYEFPNPLHDSPTIDFSFSGLKTALKYTLRDRPEAAGDLANVAASYQEAICRHLVDRLERAIRKHQDVTEVHLVGGVSANERLRVLASGCCARHDIRLRHPSALSFCTDNAAMIAAAGYFLRLEHGTSVAQSDFITQASLPLHSVFL